MAGKRKRKPEAKAAEQSAFDCNSRSEERLVEQRQVVDGEHAQLVTGARSSVRNRFPARGSQTLFRRHSLCCSFRVAFQSFVRFELYVSWKVLFLGRLVAVIILAGSLSRLFDYRM